MHTKEINEEVDIKVEGCNLKGYITIPPGARAIVVFVHGSGSSRHSSRNKLVADTLSLAGYGILLFDLLSMEVDWNHAKRFDIDLLSARLVEVTKWLEINDKTRNLAMCYFGASTGAAAALQAAADLGSKIKAIVSRGGRPDLAAHKLPLVTAPTLLIIGSLDYEVIGLNEVAFNLLIAEKRIVIVEDASHLFEEPGKLEEVAVLAREWFDEHFQFA